MFLAWGLFAALGTTAVPLAAPANTITGDLYVSLDGQYGSSTIDGLDSQGAPTTLASGLDYPSGLAFDSSGNLYFADYSNAAIRMISPGGAVHLCERDDSLRPCL